MILIIVPIHRNLICSSTNPCFMQHLTNILRLEWVRTKIISIVYINIILGTQLIYMLNVLKIYMRSFKGNIFLECHIG